MKLRAVKIACQAALLLGLIQGAVAENSGQVSNNFDSISLTKKDAPGTVMPDSGADVLPGDEERGLWDWITGKDDDDKSAVGTTTAPTTTGETTAPAVTTAAPESAVSTAASTTGLESAATDPTASASESAVADSESGSTATAPTATTKAPTTTKKTKKTKKPVVATSASGSEEAASSSTSSSGSGSAPAPKKTKKTAKKTKKPVVVASESASGSTESASSSTSSSGSGSAPAPKKTKKTAKKTKKPVVVASESASGSTESASSSTSSSGSGSAPAPKKTKKTAKKTKKPVVVASESASGSSVLSSSSSLALSSSGSMDLDLSGSGDLGAGMSGSGSLALGSSSSSGADLGSLFGSMSGSMLADLQALFGALETPTNATAEDDNIKLSKLLGGTEHGMAFSDIKSVKMTQMLANVTVRGELRVDAVSILVILPDVNLFTHGGKGGFENSIVLDIGEYVNSVEVHWDKNKKKHTSIFYLAMNTNKKNSVSAGTKTENSAMLTAPKGYQLGGFYGRSDDELYAIGAIWTKKGASDLLVSDKKDVVAAKGSVMSTYKTTIRNWVGPLESAGDTACYRKKVDASTKGVCPSGYEQSDDTCRAQCPLMYPLECMGFECIPQNTDCATEVLSKVSAVAAVALNAVTAGVFGQVLAAYKVANFAVTCALNVANAVKSLIFYLRYQQTTVATTNTEKLMDYAFKLQIVTLDMPLAICSCLGVKIPPKLEFSATILSVVSAVVMMAIMLGEVIVASAGAVMNMLKNASAMNETMLDSDVTELDSFLQSNSTCGYEIKTLTNRVMGKVYEVRNNTPDANPDDVREVISRSSLMTDDVPYVTNHCMGELLVNKTPDAAYETRNLLRKTLGVIIDDLIEKGTTDMGKNLVKKEKALEYSNLGLFVLSIFDPTGIAWMASEFVQPICSPTAYLGEIDDGSLYDALGLNTIKEAFEGSYGIWNKKGDGSVTVMFESVDVEDVSVVIRSGGNKIAEVDVAAGKTVTWTSTVEKLQDKTLYLDRWRPGFLGLPGSGGGSLLMWIPRSSEGGKVILHARLNVS